MSTCRFPPAARFSPAARAAVAGVLLILALPALAGAADCPPQPADCPVPAGRYVLASVDGGAVSFPNPVFIEFAADGALSGRVCNTFRGSATIADCILTMTQAASTRRMCIDAGLSALETRVFAMLGGGVAVIAAGDELTLRRDGGSLLFRREEPEAKQP